MVKRKVCLELFFCNKPLSLQPKNCAKERVNENVDIMKQASSFLFFEQKLLISVSAFRDAISSAQSSGLKPVFEAE